jgi:hypothetical protein
VSEITQENIERFSAAWNNWQKSHTFNQSS